MRKPVEPAFRWMNPDGTPTQYFAELLQNMWERTLTQPVSKTDPTNGQVLKYVSSTGQWTPGTDNT